MIHRRDAEGAEKKFIYKNLCGLCVSAVRYKNVALKAIFG
jgi:hypothetical protein